MRHFHHRLPALALVSLLFGGANAATTLQPEQDAGVGRAGFDTSVRPQDDFFRYVNGTWLKTTEIPADKSRVGAFIVLRDRSEAQLRGLIEDAARTRDTPDARRLGDLYDSFMDEAAVEKAGLGPLSAELAAIDAMSSVGQLGAELGRLEVLGVSLPIYTSVSVDARDATHYIPVVGQGGLLLPDRDYYLVAGDAKFAQARAAELAYLTALLTLSGSGAGPEAASQAQSIQGLETALARGQWSRVENRNPVKAYNKVAVGALGDQAAGFDWPGYLAALGVAGKAGDVVVRQPTYLHAFSEQLAATPLPVWKSYLRAHLLHSYAPYLDKAYVDAHFAFTGTALLGTTENVPRWKRGVALVQASEGEAAGKLYVAKYFPPESKARMETLVANLLAAYSDSIDSLDWMSAETKKEAKAKLARFTPKIGYPNRWIDYSALVIRRDDLLGNVERARAFEHARDIAKLGRPVDRDEWHMTPQTVNAYYNPTLNEVVFPAAILQPPFFDPKADDAVNYGGIGAVIGHEISHGFDDSGSQYDGLGNLRLWWTPDDRGRFGLKTKALVDEYSAFSPVPGYTINGGLTLGENIADNAGLEIAYKAYHASLGGRPAPVIDGMTGDQRFFYGFAQIWRAKTRDAAVLSQIKSDPHSPEEFRVNGVVRNHSAFYATFNVKPGDAMYVPPEKRVSIW